MRFGLGVIVGVGLVVFLAYLWIWGGGMPVATKGGPLPFERSLAHLALRAALKEAREKKSPIPVTPAGLAQGARIYRQNCAVCHGLPGGRETAIARGMFPPPPQLFNPKDRVTDDPIGATYWKVTNGIRLSGMPGFADALHDDELWKVSLLLQQADRLPPEATRELAP